MKPAEISKELRRMFPLRWEMTRRYRLPTSEPDQPYYIAWSAAPRPKGEGWATAQFDRDGALVTESGLYTPVTMAQFAFHEYAQYTAKKTPLARIRFLAQADYFVRHQRDDGGYPYSLALPDYGARPGWLSAMAQGEIASVLLRAYALTGDERYLERGVRALSPLKLDTRSGGATFFRDGAVFFEEVATDDPCHILNGHLFAAFGVWEYVRFGIAGDDIYALHQDAVRTLESWLPKFDCDGWSAYDLALDEHGRRHLSPMWYHQFHIAQLHVYGCMTGVRAFSEMSERWRDALARKRVRAQVWRYHADSLVHAVRRRISRKGRTFRPI